jgi:plasmid stabilization system protein ParE
MPHLIWSPPALRDVQRLYRFLADNNADAARRAVKAIRDGVKVIARHPGIGRPAENMDLEYREWLIEFGSSGYVALYRYDGKTAVILAVRHQREIEYD